MKIMYTTQELLELWANNDKRREFVNNYQVWGVWFTQPELDLTYFKYDLPDGKKLIAMEYLRESHAWEKDAGHDEPIVNTNFYLWKEKHFNPSSASEYEMADCLKILKTTLGKEQKQRDMQCKNCASRSFRHTPDESVFCAICSVQL